MGRLTPPPFTRVAIVGLGLIGGSIALATKRRWPAVRLIAIDRAEVVTTALAMGAVDAGGDGLDFARDADLVVLAAPVLQNVAALAQLAAHLTQPAVVTDVGSTKRAIAAQAATLPEHLSFIGGHPLSGAAVSGLAAARPDLFDDRPWILTDTSSAPPRAVAALEQFVTGLKAVPHAMGSSDHDRLLAYISHLPQLAVTALMAVVGAAAGGDGLALAGRGLRDTTRLATSPVHTWRDILATNGENITVAIDDLIGVLEQLKPMVAAGAPPIDTLFTAAAKWKGVLEHQ